jgi:nucleosome binding factor SPN SPT16 subunit
MGRNPNYPIGWIRKFFAEKLNLNKIFLILENIKLLEKTRKRHRFSPRAQELAMEYIQCIKNVVTASNVAMNIKQDMLNWANLIKKIFIRYGLL